MPEHPTTPRLWRIALAFVLATVVVTAYAIRDAAAAPVRSMLGVVAFLVLACLLSRNLRAINWRTVGAGFALQLILAVLILRVPWVYSFFRSMSEVIQKFIDFTNEGAAFVFGPLLNDAALEKGLALQNGGGFIFVVKALPAVIFVSSFFTVMYFLGVLQFVVKLLARVMVWVMGTSGAETLSATANVFMGQTEAPLIVRPYITRMTRSELLTLMVGGMATISGGVMVAYVGMLNTIGMGEQAVAILATSVMAAPCGLYIAKILLPETEEPVTRGDVKVEIPQSHANVFDAAAEGASEGMKLVLNITAMLIAFIAFVALVNHLLAQLDATFGVQQALGLTRPLSLQLIFSWLFAPVALLMGVSSADVPQVGELLGTKLVLNEFVAYLMLSTQYGGQLEPRSVALTAFALTGFANFASIGIQLGGIGAMAPERRGELAQLGLLALTGGFLATLINSAVAGMLI
ncbi:MAG: nucleoside transporter C-terminal domain-containing protein [Gemmataceae bacterium]|nr:Na+ dependent nucleoside transporter domain protein [Gemmata sp.]MDW8199293.1 nucleoside transporter C-terminal domain-containing protein [Gemmataceae bacterium]